MSKKVAAGLFLAVLLSCGGRSFSEEISFDFDNPKYEDLSGFLTPAYPSVQADRAPSKEKAEVIDMSSPEKDWTVIIFVSGKNDLQEAAVPDTNLMETVGSTDRMNVVLEVVRSTPVPKNTYAGKPVYPENGSDWKEIRRFYVTKDENPEKISSPVIETLPQHTDTGDWKHLAEFGKWAKKKYPAKHYMLVIWSHGSGWRAHDGALFTQNISFDDENGTSISIPDLKKALSAMGGVDVYASDACLMQGVETAYELRKHAKVVVGSEEILPAKGYPYHLLLSAINSAPELTAEDAGRLAVENFALYHKDNDWKKYDAAILSAVRTSALQELREKLDAWVQILMRMRPEDFKPVLSNALDNSRFFRDTEIKDLLNVVERASEASRSQELKDKGAEITNFMRERVVIANTNATPGYENANGLSVYLPVQRYDNFYSRLDWAKTGKWDDFVKWISTAYFERNQP